MFSKRIHPSKIPAIEALLKDGIVSGPIVKESVELPVWAKNRDDLLKQTKLLLDDVERLTQDKRSLEEEVLRAMATSDDTKVIFWRSKCLAMEKVMNDGSV